MKTGDASAEIWLETSDGAFYCLDVCSKLRRGVHVYHWAVDFYADDEATEPVEVAAGSCTSYRIAETAARRTADENEANRRAAKRSGRRSTR